MCPTRRASLQFHRFDSHERTGNSIRLRSQCQRAAPRPSLREPPSIMSPRLRPGRVLGRWPWQAVAVTEMLRVCEEVSAAAWIAPRLGGAFGAVTQAVPVGFEDYARICHPAE